MVAKCIHPELPWDYFGTNRFTGGLEYFVHVSILSSSAWAKDPTKYNSTSPIRANAYTGATARTPESNNDPQSRRTLPFVWANSSR